MKTNKMMWRSMAGALSAVLIGSALQGCGGGGGDAAPAVSSPAEGIYSGTLSASTNTDFEMLILENGDFWTMYGVNSGSVFRVAGFVQGGSTASGGSLTSTNSKDFGFAPAVAGTISASYNPAAKTITGTASAGPQSVSFSGGPIPGSLYNYDTPATLAMLQGTWSLASLTGEGIALNVNASGAYTALSTQGCSFSGSITPRSSGKNVFNVSMSFGPAPCALAGQSASGIAVAYPITGGLTQLLVAAVDSSRTYGAAAFGTR